MASSAAIMFGSSFASSACPTWMIPLSLVLISGPPFVAFMYAVFVWMTYAINHEISWCSKGKALSLRCSVWIASIAVAIGICRSCNKEPATTSSFWWWWWWLISVVIMISWTGGGYLMVQTRREDVVGIASAPYYGKTAMANKLVLITGANNGIGKETTQQLASMGATVVLLCRSRSRAESAIRDILLRQQQCNDYNGDGEVVIREDQLAFVPLDLGDFASIHKAVSIVREQFIGNNNKFQHVDVLINNAGLMMGTKTISKDGCELMMQANHLGHYLLTRLLLEQGLLRTTNVLTQEPSRILNLTSSTYEFSANGFDFEDMFCDGIGSTGNTNDDDGKGNKNKMTVRPYTLFGQYSMTKLANLLTTKELARRYSTNNFDDNKNNVETGKQKSQLTVFAVHPGIVRTNVTSNMQWFWRVPNDMFAWFVKSVQKTPSEGAFSSVYAAAAPLDVLPTSGSYILNCKAHPTLPTADSKDDARRLWQVSEQLVGLTTTSDQKMTKDKDPKKSSFVEEKKE